MLFSGLQILLQVCSFFTGLTILGTGGSVVRPQTDLERGVVLVVALIALFVVATFIGSISDVISKINANDEQFRNKMSHVNLFMKNRELPDDIQARIRNYYRSLWSRQGKTHFPFF
jgi:hypothetical protein